jgi:opacity protein-like surface antigen
MVCKEITKIVFLFLLVFVVAVAPALAADVVSNNDVDGFFSSVNEGAGSSSGNIIPVNNNEDHFTSSGDDSKEVVPTKKSDASGFDKVYSEDTVFGFEKNKDYKIEDHYNGQEAIDSASSIPIWNICMVLLLILGVYVFLESIGVSLFNQHKISKSANDENPNKAAEGIKAGVKVQKEYMKSWIWTFGSVVVICFAVFTFLV